MKKMAKILWTMAIIVLLFCVGVLVGDKHTLHTQIIRMHVLANSDSEEDQALKLAVRDAVMEHLNKKLNSVKDSAAAYQIIVKELIALEKVANTVLANKGSCDIATVTIAQEPFEMRMYDTFHLPAGVYQSLRIQIGSGNGRNWWCVVFPAFCAPGTGSQFQTTAVSSGFDQGLVSALSNNEEYEFRFFLLDCLGKLENFLNIS